MYADTTVSHIETNGSVENDDSEDGPHVLSGAMGSTIEVTDTTDDGTSQGISLGHGGSITGIDLTVTGGGLFGEGNITGDLTVGEGASVNPYDTEDDGNTTLSGLFDVTGDVTFEAGSELSLIARGAGGPNDAAGTSRLDVTGTTTISQDNTSLSIATSYVPAGNGSFNAIEGSTPPVGAFSYTYRLRIQAADDSTPDFPEGLYSISATNGNNITVTDRIASLSVAAGVIRPGQALTYSGSGFVPGETVYLALEKAQPMSEADFGIGLVTTVASGSGTIGGTFTVPATVAPGAYRFSAGGNGFVSAAVTITAVEVPAPLDTDGDKLNDSVDCAPNDKTKPAQGAGVVDKDCNGVNDAIQPVKFVGSTKSDTITGAGGNDVLSGGAGNDKLAGGFGNDKLLGGTGNDKLDGGAGNDTLDGGTGNDSLAGGSGNDKMAGGSGNDTLNGGVGKDVLNGGPGNDRIVAGDRLTDKVVCGPGRDVVTADKGDKVAKDCEVVKRR